MAGLLCKRFPHKAPELVAYLSSIVYAERCYESGRWLAYDRQFRREVLARKCLDWSVPNQRLYTEAFTGRGKPIPRCSVCLQDIIGLRGVPITRTTSGRHCSLGPSQVPSHSVRGKEAMLPLNHPVEQTSSVVNLMTVVAGYPHAATSIHAESVVEVILHCIATETVNELVLLLGHHFKHRVNRVPLVGDHGHGPGSTKSLAPHKLVK